MRCANCGNNAPEGSAFCNRCGQRLHLETVPPSKSDAEGATAPDWYLELLDTDGELKLEEPAKGFKRIQTGISGNQPRKWVAEMAAGQQVRILYADGHLRHRSRRPWERDDAQLLRYPWTSEDEGTLLLIVADQVYRFRDLKTDWVSADHHVQVYIGIEDSRHDDNTGSYRVILEITPGPELE